TATQSVTIVAGKTPPTVTVLAPANGTTAPVWTPITFRGSATDAGDGDLGANLRWSSSLDGPIGTGATVTAARLSRGVHVVTAQAADSRGLTGTDSVVVVITGGPPTRAPDVSIVAPGPGAELALGAPVTFTAIAADDSGDLSARIVWVSQAGGDLAGELRTVSGAWDELGVTHLNKPAMDGTLLASAGAVDPSANVDFDVTAVVAADGVYNFGLRTPSSNGVEYVAREGGTG